MAEAHNPATRDSWERARAQAAALGVHAVSCFLSSQLLQFHRPAGRRSYLAIASSARFSRPSRWSWTSITPSLTSGPGRVESTLRRRSFWQQILFSMILIAGRSRTPPNVALKLTGGLPRREDAEQELGTPEHVDAGFARSLTLVLAGRVDVMKVSRNAFASRSFLAVAITACGSTNNRMAVLEQRVARLEAAPAATPGPQEDRPLPAFAAEDGWSISGGGRRQARANGFRDGTNRKRRACNAGDDIISDLRSSPLGPKSCARSDRWEWAPA